MKLSALMLFALVATLPLAASIITVTSLNDSGPGSLRSAIASASNGDTIDFASALSGGTIVLSSGAQLIISTSLTIDGGSGITIQSDTVSNIFSVVGATTDTFSNLTLLNANNAIAGSGSASISLTNSTISDSSAGLANVNVTVVNSTFSGNTSAIIGGTVSLYDSTISGGTIGIENTSLTIGNSIIAGNGTDIGTGNTVMDSGNNLIGNGGGLFTNGVDGDIVGTSPDLGSLANNGGPTLTYALLAGSPAIDSGNNSLIPAGVTTDQRGPGFARISGSAVDIGAFEFQQATVPEPATYVTCLLGFALLAAKSRWKP